MRFLGWLFGHRPGPADRSDIAREAIDSAQSARKEMHRYVHLRQREVAAVRLEQMELRQSINKMEQAILADKLLKESHDAVG